MINVSKNDILLRRAVVSDYAWYPQPYMYPQDQIAPPKYDGPFAQLNDTLLGSIVPEEIYEVGDK